MKSKNDAQLALTLSFPSEVTITTSGLALDGIDESGWREVGKVLGRIGRAHQWWIGDWLRYGERQWGERYTEAEELTGLDYQTLRDLAYVAGTYSLSRRRDKLSFSHHREVAALSPSEADAWLEKAEAEGLTQKELRRAVRAPQQLSPVAPASGVYRCVVVDPPWPMERIERDIRPDDSPFLDYATMELDAIENWWDQQNLQPSEEGCHVWLWATQRFLRPAFDVMQAWGCPAQTTLVWRKNTGMMPFAPGFYYDSEFVLFGRFGGLDLQRKGAKTIFDAPTTGHSRKPDAFYEMVRELSPEPRIDCFAREPREGFDIWGDQA